MWLERLSIRGFGCLRDLELELGERVTVVTGLNEAGKSTLHAALMAALFGFFDSADGRTQRANEALRARYEPWSGAAYGLGASVRMAGDRRIALEWDFSGRTSVAAYDGVTGADLTADVRGGAGCVLDSARVWGVGRDFFARACFVRQGDLGAVEDGDGAIARTIEAVASSGGRDASARRAIGLLDRALREEVGSDRAPTRPLARAQARRAALEAELAEVTARRVALEGLARDRATAEARAARLGAELEGVTAALDARLLADLQERLAGLADAERRLSEVDARLEELGDVAPPSDDDLAEIAARAARREDLLAALESARLDAREAEPKAAEIAARLSAQQEELTGAEPSPESLEPPEDLLALEARAEAEREEREQLRTAGSTGAIDRPRGIAAAAVASLVGAAAGGAAGVPPAGVAGLAAIAVLLWIAWFVRARRPGPASATRLAALDATVAQARARRADFDRRAGEIARRRIERTTLELEVRELRAELAHARVPLDRAEALEEELRAVEAGLAAAYRRCGIDEQDLDRAAEVYEARLEECDRYDAESAEKRRIEALREGFLAGTTASELRGQAAELEARGADPAAAPAGCDAAELRARAEDLGREAAEARSLASQIAGRLEGALEGLPEPARLEEELADARDELAGLEEARSVLTLAKETLERAAEEAYRDVAPRLNETLGRTLARVTGGRYERAWVAPDFSVRVEAPEHGRLVDMDCLSRGTQEQIYLIERLELVRLLAGTDPLPVLLDDPLTHCDPVRREALAAVLDEVASERQLVILSTDPGVADLLDRACEGCVALSLDPVPARAR